MGSVSLIDGHIDEVREKITNGDYIRSLNDKELAKFSMTSWFVDGVCKHCEGEYDQCGNREFCIGKIYEWLVKERK